MRKRKRLLWHIYPSFLLITLLSVAAVTWYAANSLRKFYLDQTKLDLEARAYLIIDQITPYLSPLSPISADAVDNICKQSGRNASTRITVILKSGKVIGDSDKNPDVMDNHVNRPEVIKALGGDVGSAIRYSNTLEKKMMYVALPFRQNNHITTIIRTSLSISSIDEAVWHIEKQIIFWAFVIALVIAGVSLYISRRITRPIEEMKQGATEFSKGNLDHRLPYPESEELAELTEALNQMALQVNDRIKTIDRQRNELETVLSSMDEGVIAVDQSERVLSINQAAAKMFQLRSSGVQGRMIQEVVRHKELERFISEALSANDSIAVDLTLYQDEERVLNAHTTPLKGAAEENIGILLVLNDVTQLRKLETMRRDFVANVSHEIKTPLTAIKGFVETLHQGAVSNPDEAERFLGIIDRHVHRLEAIIDDLLKLSRIEQEEKDHIVFEKHPIKGIIQSAVQVCQAKATARNIQIQVDCAIDTSANMDVHLMEQAAVNLLDNAINYSEKDGSILVTAVFSDSEILISFEDNGIGIAKEHLPRLFERFYRVDKARSRKLGGTGLGLSIVKHIVQAHGGKISVESTHGKGSTFTIHLPIPKIS